MSATEPTWGTFQLHDVCRPKQWKTIKKSDMTESGYPVYGANGVIGRYHSFNHVDPTILVGCRGSCGAVNVSEPNAWVTGNAMALDDLDTSVIDLGFLVHALLADGLKAAITGTSQPQITQTSLKRIRLPLPPMHQQRRIAAVLNAAEALRAKRREALSKLDTLTQAVFHDMFGAAIGEMQLLGDLGEVQGGLQVSAKRKGHPIEVPYLRVANVYRGRLDLSVIKTLQVTERELSRALLQEGDLLVVEGHGNKDEIGRVGVWDGSIDPCVHQNHLIRVRCDRRRLLPRFAETFMNSQIGRQALLRAANTTSGLNTISTSDVRSVVVPVPALSDQWRFVEAATRVDQHRSTLTKSAAALDQLFASLQQRAFRGEL